MSILCRFRGVLVCLNVSQMFKNKKLIGLMMSVAITLLMASVYLFSLQLMDDSPTAQEELAQEVQESSEAVS